MIYKGMKFEYLRLSSCFKGVEIGDKLVISEIIDENNFIFHHKNLYTEKFYECTLNKLNFHLLNGYLKKI